MWAERITHVLIRAEVSTEQLTKWVRLALPAFDRDVREAAVSAWKLRNGTTLVGLVSPGDQRRRPRSMDESWSSPADPFAVHLATLAAGDGLEVVVVDKRTTAHQWAVLSFGQKPSGAMMTPPGPPAAGRCWVQGRWASDTQAEALAGTWLREMTGRSVWDPDGYAQWWQEGDHSRLQVVLEPHVVVRRGKRLLEPAPSLLEPQPSALTRLFEWVAQR